MALDYQVSQKIVTPQLAAITDNSARQNLLPLTNGLGYSTGAGAAVTQLTNRSTTVAINALCGAITTDTTSLAALAIATFAVANTKVASGDTIILTKRAGAGAKTDVRVSSVENGSFGISVHNIDAAAAELGAIVINFAVIKAVAA